LLVFLGSSSARRPGGRITGREGIFDSLVDFLLRALVVGPVGIRLVAAAGPCVRYGVLLCCHDRLPSEDHAPQHARAGSRSSAVVARQPGNTVDLYPFIPQAARLVRRGLAVNVAMLGLAIVDLARHLREARPDIVAILFDMAPQLAQRLDDTRALRQRRIVRDLRGRRRLLGPLAEARRHQRLANRGRAADWTDDLRRLQLFVGRRAVPEPGLELVILLAAELVDDHGVDEPLAPIRTSDCNMWELVSPSCR